MKKLIAFALLASAGLAQAASFDCREARSLVEQAVCMDRELSSKDSLMSSLYRASLSGATQSKKTQITLAQKQWLRQRNSCASANCLHSVYDARIEQLQVTPTASWENFPPSDKKLIDRFDALNGRCRGGSSDNPATMRACAQRDALMSQIKARNICWGYENQYEYQKQWVRCR